MLLFYPLSGLLEAEVSIAQPLTLLLSEVSYNRTEVMGFQVRNLRHSA